MKPKISVLVPIYNVSKFLPECLDSLVSQTLRDIEIICINDGSTDDSLAIVKKYAKKDPRIVIIDKPNSGYGDSMNKGLAKATGKYIGIVESDDWIAEDAFEKLYSLAEKHKAEVVKANYFFYYGDTHEDRGKSMLFQPDEIGRLIDPAKNRDIFYQAPSIWAAIYKRDFIIKNGISFLPSPGASYQDAGFNLKVWSMCHRAVFTDEAFLHYRQDNTNSSVKSSGKIYVVKDEYDAVVQFLKDKNIYDFYAPIVFTCRMGAYIWNLNRLKFGAAIKFSRCVKAEYRRARKEGIMDSPTFDEVGKYKATTIAAKYPTLYVIIKPLYHYAKTLKTPKN